MALLFLSLSWIAGIFTGYSISMPLWSLAFSIFPFIFLPWLRNHKKWLVLAGLILLVFMSGNTYYRSTLSQIYRNVLSFYNETNQITIEGSISGDPATNDKTTQFSLKADYVYLESGKQSISGTALITTLNYEGYHYGDQLKITGDLQTPTALGDFDYKSYLSRKDIYSVMVFPHIQNLHINTGFQPLSWIYNLRHKFSDSINMALPQPQGSLAEALLLGITGNIPQSLKQSFQATGTTHILAISGLNLTIIIGILLTVGVWLFGRRYSIHIWLSLVIIWLYTIFTGMNPPIVRSAIMGSMFLIAEFFGRQKTSITALTFAAAIMVGLQPGLLGDVSFQLSFLSIAGLILIYPHFHRLVRIEKTLEINSGFFMNALNVFADSFIVTLSAILATLPILAYNFGIVSLLSLPATVFILPIMPAMIVITALLSIAGLFAPWLAMAIGWIDWLFLSYFVLIIQIFSSLPLASFHLNNFPLWLVTGYYLLLAAVLLLINFWKHLAKYMQLSLEKIKFFANRGVEFVERPQLKWLIISVLLMTILVWAAIFSLPDNKLHVSILDVGQGDAILIQTPDRQNILIDGGPGTQDIKQELSKKLPFWNRNIDLMIVSQPQADHITGLLTVANEYHVNRVISSPVTEGSAVSDQLALVIKERKIESDNVSSGQIIDLGNNLRIEVLHPPAQLFVSKSNSINNNSLVLRLIWNNVSFLLTSDVDQEVEGYLLDERADIKSTVLMVGHHGSKTSSSNDFLSGVNMKTAVISVGIDNRYGHPDAETLTRLNQYLDTDSIFLTSQNGTIEFTTDGSRLWVKTDRSSNSGS